MPYRSDRAPDDTWAFIGRIEAALINIRHRHGCWAAFSHKNWIANTILRAVADQPDRERLWSIIAALRTLAAAAENPDAVPLDTLVNCAVTAGFEELLGINPGMRPKG